MRIYLTTLNPQRVLIRQVRPLEDDGEEDIKGYNKELEQLGNPKWFEAPWLFIECYLYR